MSIQNTIKSSWITFHGPECAAWKSISSNYNERVANTGLPERAKEILRMIPTLDQMQGLVTSIKEGREILPSSLGDHFIKSLEEMSHVLQNAAQNIDIVEKYRTWHKNLFSAASQLLKLQTTFMHRNLALLTVGILSLLIAETNLVNPKDGDTSKKNYARTTLKVVGYGLLALAAVLTFRTLNSANFDLRGFDPFNIGYQFIPSHLNIPNRIGALHCMPCKDT